MLNKKEILMILLTTLILAFVINLGRNIETFTFILFSIFIIIIANVLTKKMTSYYFDSEIEIKLWEIKRYGLLHFFNFLPFSKTHPSREFKIPFQAGAFFPIVITLLSFGYIKWLAALVFDIQIKTHKAAKRHGLYLFSEIAENHIGLIAASGIFMNLLLAVIGYLIGFDEFSKLNIYYAFFNMLPISDLDGNKIFFGSLILWSFLAALVLIGVAYTILVI